MGIAALDHPAWKAVAQGAVVIAVATLGPAALAPLLRVRRADPVQRQQLKWFAFVVGICVVSVLVTVPVRGVLPLVATPLYYVPVAGVVVGLPAAVGLAILRYRLYDIDRLINRALVYATLTAVLGLGYAGAVLALGQLFGGVGERTPSWAVAGATLAVAALFQPARRRIQQAVDRRPGFLGQGRHRRRAGGNGQAATKYAPPTPNGAGPERVAVLAAQARARFRAAA
jgi:hypothetical protein